MAEIGENLRLCNLLLKFLSLGSLISERFLAKNQLQRHS